MIQQYKVQCMITAYMCSAASCVWAGVAFFQPQKHELLHMKLALSRHAIRVETSSIFWWRPNLQDLQQITTVGSNRRKDGHGKNNPALTVNIAAQAWWRKMVVRCLAEAFYNGPITLLCKRYAEHELQQSTCPLKDEHASLTPPQLQFYSGWAGMTSCDQQQKMMSKVQTWSVWTLNQPSSYAFRTKAPSWNGRWPTLF